MEKGVVNLITQEPENSSSDVMTEGSHCTGHFSLATFAMLAIKVIKYKAEA